MTFHCPKCTANVYSNGRIIKYGEGGGVDEIEGVPRFFCIVKGGFQKESLMKTRVSNFF